MTASMKWIGMLATLAILVVLPLYTWLEPGQQTQLLEDYNRDSVVSAADMYAQNCVVCHGAAGEGIGDSPPLNTEAVRMMSEVDLARVIARGRDNTLMAAWAAEEGGVFSNPQIGDLVTFVQQVNWDYVDMRVTELGLTPPQMIEMEISDEMLASLAALPDGDVLEAGLMVFAQNCAACHGANGAGTLIAPAIDSSSLRETPQAELVQLVNTGVTGTLMAGWQGMLEPEEINSVVDLIYRWPELIQTGMEFPQAEGLDVPLSPELIASGNKLFNVACKSCHGVDGYGSPMAPAVNNQIFLAETPDAAIYQIIAGGIPGTMMPAWGNRLDDQEIQSLVAFLRIQEPSAPAILPPILAP